jgi:hypothetical protein
MRRRLALVPGFVLAIALLGWPALARSSPSLAVLAAPLGTTFTYQGQLKLNGQLVTGTGDLQFSLFDASAGGAQVGASPQTVLNVPVTNGLYTVQLDFGASPFTGQATWLELAPRCPAGGGGFIILSPRQPVSPTPNALFAQQAQSATSATMASSATTATTATNFSGSLAGDVTGTQTSTSVTALRGTALAATAPTTGQVLRYDGTQWGPASAASGTVTSVGTGAGLSGGPITATGTVDLALDPAGGLSKALGAGSNLLGIAPGGITPGMVGSGTYGIDISGNAATATTASSATTATTATNFSGSLAGDVTGTQGATVVSNVGGVTAANVANGVNRANTATSADTANTLALRDGSGNFALNTLTLDANLALPNTTSGGATGVLSLGGSRFLHNFGSRNTFLGQAAGNFSLSGTDNTGIGNGALAATTTGGTNTALGRAALAANTNGGFNTAVGGNALTANTSGNSNTALGQAALQNNTTGGPNTAVGGAALLQNTTGGDNTAVGGNALFSNNASANTAVGQDALLSNTTGDSNTGVGSSALRGNTTGGFNTAVGSSALTNNLTGDNNAALGLAALQNNSNGSNNAAIGQVALLSNTSGSSNTAIGQAALLSNSTGNNNTALGASALPSVGGGSGNIAIGASAGNAYAGNAVNNIAIGNGGSGADSGTIRIGTNGIQTTAFIAGIRAVATGANDAIPVVIDSNGQLGTISSSARFKDHVADMGEASAVVHALRPVTFQYKPEYGGGPDHPQVGLIAEEVAQVAPWLVVYDADGQPFTVHYEMLTPLLLNELQAQQRTIETQASEQDALRAEKDAQLATQEAEIGALQTQVTAQQEELAGLQAQDAALQALAARLATLEQAVGQ